MANLSYLYELSSKGMPLDDRDQLLASGRYIIPLFWLATFDMNDIENFIDEEGDNLPYLHVNVEKAIETFEKNKQQLEMLSKDINPYFSSWVNILKNLESKYIAVDPTEILFMVDTDYHRIYDAIQFFVEQTAETFDALFNLTCFPDILNEKEIRKYAMVDGVESQTPASEYLIGWLEEKRTEQPKTSWWKVWK